MTLSKMSWTSQRCLKMLNEIRVQELEMSFNNNSKTKFKKTKKQRWCERYEHKWTCEPDRPTRLLFWVWPGSLPTYLRTYLPTYTAAEPAGDRAHLTAHHLRLPFLLSNTGRFSYFPPFLFTAQEREREREKGETTRWASVRGGAI